LIVFVIFVRAYLANRLETEYLDRGQTALNTAQRVIEDYLASSTNTTKPEQVLDDEVLSWLALVIGHDLHLYRDEKLIASSHHDLHPAGFRGSGIDRGGLPHGQNRHPPSSGPGSGSACRGAGPLRRRCSCPIRSRPGPAGHHLSRYGAIDSPPAERSSPRARP